MLRSILMLLLLSTVCWTLPGCTPGEDDEPLLDTGVEEPSFTPFDAKLMASDAAEGDLFGFAVSLDGSVVAVGAVGATICLTAALDSCVQSGAAYVFERDPVEAGIWNESIKLSIVDTPEVPMERDLFGFSVALDTETLVVGAPGAGCEAQACDPFAANDPPLSCGRVYVFGRSVDDPPTWQTQAVLLPPQATGGQPQEAIRGFGASLALDGDDLVVGAPTSWCAGQTDCGDVCGSASCSPQICGAAYRYERTGGDWSAVSDPAMSWTGAREGDAFGLAVALADDRLAVGAPGCTGEPGVACWPGETHASTTDDAGPLPLLTRTDPVAGDRFGSALAMQGPTLVVGEPRADDRCPNTWPECSSGHAHVYERVAGADVWEPVDVLRVVKVDPLDRVGSAVAIHGDRIVLGARGDDQAAIDAGAVHVYERDGDTWAPALEIIPADAETRDLFGAAVSLEAGTLVVGAFREDEACPPDPDCLVDCAIPPSCNTGAVYVFELE